MNPKPMTDRERKVSAALDWCVVTLDTLNQLPPERAEQCGAAMVRGWKRRLEREIPEPSEQV